MEIIWDRGEVSVSKVWDVLQERRDVARNSVQTMIVRIERKGRPVGSNQCDGGSEHDTGFAAVRFL